MTTIELEDKGQDFTHWTCDETGKVVKCEPFQGWLWEGVTVLGAAEYIYRVCEKERELREGAP